MWVNEGMSLRNSALLQAVAQALAAVRGPWILSGDFNMRPEALAATGWLGLVGGVIVSPKAATSGS